MLEFFFKHKFLPILFGVALFSTVETYAQEGLDAFVKAENFRQNQDFTNALLEYDKAILKEPKNLKYLYNKCLCFHETQKKPKETIECFQKVVTAQSDYNLTAYELIAENYVKLDNADEAIKNYEIAYKKREDVSYKYYILDLLFKEGRAVEALPHIEVARKLAPEDFQIMYFEARYHNIMGTHEEALASMKKVFEILGSEVSGPDFAKYFYELGYAEHALGNYSAANQAFAGARENNYFNLKVKELSWENYLAVAKSYLDIFENEVARDLLNKVLMMQPDQPEAKELVKKMEANQADATTSIASLVSRVNDMKKKGASPMQLAPLQNELAIRYFQTGNYDDALKCANEYLSVNANDVRVQFLRGACEYRLGNSDEAEYVFESIGKSAKVEGEARVKCYFAMGVVQRKTKQYDLARKTFKKALGGTFVAAAKYETELIKRTVQQEKGGKLKK
ncbi:MAG: hypothetical protein EAZ57_02720 [Cytophagales bacterium]|nr:MAG: hypothetical protein EAZ67_03185 [Cytophagales bacterium]TAF61675.1 MAG: hypothetical protein EAZ57_02720 [Cytophagales bacterium]